MTKADLITGVKAAVEKETGKDVSKKMVKSVIDSTLEAINGCMEKGEELLLQPVGRFGVKFRNPRKATNMTTGEPIAVPAKYVPHFSPTSKLKDAVASLPVE